MVDLNKMIGSSSIGCIYMATAQAFLILIYWANVGTGTGHLIGLGVLKPSQAVLQVSFGNASTRTNNCRKS